MTELSREEVEEIASEEGIEIGGCFWQFRQIHESCVWCRARGFCDRIKKTVEEYEKEGE